MDLQKICYYLNKADAYTCSSYYASENTEASSLIITIFSRLTYSHFKLSHKEKNITRNFRVM